MCHEPLRFLAVRVLGVLVKRILKRFGYPPELSDEAVQTVLAQAEILLKSI